MLTHKTIIEYQVLNDAGHKITTCTTKNQAFATIARVKRTVGIDLYIREMKRNVPVNTHPWTVTFNPSDAHIAMVEAYQAQVNSRQAAEIAAAQSRAYAQALSEEIALQNFTITSGNTTIPWGLRIR